MKRTVTNQLNKKWHCSLNAVLITLKFFSYTCYIHLDMYYDVLCEYVLKRVFYIEFYFYLCP